MFAAVADCIKSGNVHAPSVGVVRDLVKTIDPKKSRTDPDLSVTGDSSQSFANALDTKKSEAELNQHSDGLAEVADRGSYNLMTA